MINSTHPAQLYVLLLMHMRSCDFYRALSDISSPLDYSWPLTAPDSRNEIHVKLLKSLSAQDKLIIQLWEDFRKIDKDSQAALAKYLSDAKTLSDGIKTARTGFNESAVKHLAGERPFVWQRFRPLRRGDDCCRDAAIGFCHGGCRRSPLEDKIYQEATQADRRHAGRFGVNDHAPAKPSASPNLRLLKYRHTHA